MGSGASKGGKCNNQEEKKSKCLAKKKIIYRYFFPPGQISLSDENIISDSSSLSGTNPLSKFF